MLRNNLPDPLSIETRKNTGINIPNILSVVRFLIAPLFVILLLKGMFPFALFVFTIAGITDALDGLIAKYFNQKTVLGSYLDPIADKFLLASAFVILAVLKIIPGWLTVIVLTRDIIIGIAYIIFALKNIQFAEIQPSFISKCTTTAQFTAVIVTLFSLHASGFSIIKMSVIWLTAGLTVSSGMHYIYVGLNILQDALGNHEHIP